MIFLIIWVVGTCLSLLYMAVISDTLDTYVETLARLCVYIIVSALWPITWLAMAIRWILKEWL